MTAMPAKPDCPAQATIRDAHPADAEIIAAFNRATALETENLKIPVNLSVEGVRVALDDPNRARYFLAEIDGRVAGQMMLTLEWSDWRSGFFWWIQSVYVHPDFRRRGVLRSLYLHVRRLAESDPNVCGLRLYVHHDNAHAMNTYRRLGMTETQYLVFEKCFESRASAEHAEV
jgi:ribosomal protein S18 acetylase RimI-like enzyme